MIIYVFLDQLKWAPLNQKQVDKNISLYIPLNHQNVNMLWFILAHQSRNISKVVKTNCSWSRYFLSICINYDVHYARSLKIKCVFVLLMLCFVLWCFLYDFLYYGFVCFFVCLIDLLVCLAFVFVFFSIMQKNKLLLLP